MDVTRTDCILIHSKNGSVEGSLSRSRGEDETYSMLREGFNRGRVGNRNKECREGIWDVTSI